MALTDKVVLITGAGRRIGATVATRLHADGMNVVLHYRSSADAAGKLCEQLNATRDHSAALVQADLLKIDAFETMISEATQHWGRLDAMVNNASSFFPTPLGSVTEEQWDNLIGTNFKAPFFLSQAAAPALREHNGCIVNMVDIHAERPMHHHAVYSAAKAGLVSVTKALARELAPEIRVNGVAPGAILWPEDLDDETRDKILSRIALKRAGRPEDIAATIAFLIGDAPYITGQIIAVDGGRSLNI